jgi:hypothetical protein
MKTPCFFNHCIESKKHAILLCSEIKQLKD